VDEALIRDKRLRALTSADELELTKRPPERHPSTRDPADLLDVLLSALG
jgi:hypothetical protein